MQLIEAAGAGPTPEDYRIARQVAEVLDRTYPGHLWAVNVDAKHAMVIVRNFRLPMKYGFRLKLDTEYSASNLEARVKRAGGEILERYRLDRGRFDLDQWADLPERAGQIVGEVT